MRSAVPVSRVNDPISSHEAEESINRYGARAVQQEIILSVVRNHPGRTSRELTEFCDLDRYQIARRLSDLESSGHVVKGRARECLVGGRKSVTWFHHSPRKQMELF